MSRVLSSPFNAYRPLKHDRRKTWQFTRDEIHLHDELQLQVEYRDLDGVEHRVTACMEGEGSGTLIRVICGWTRTGRKWRGRYGVTRDITDSLTEIELGEIERLAMESWEAGHAEEPGQGEEIEEEAGQ